MRLIIITALLTVLAACGGPTEVLPPNITPLELRQVDACKKELLERLPTTMTVRTFEVERLQPKKHEDATLSVSINLGQDKDPSAGMCLVIDGQPGHLSIFTAEGARFYTLQHGEWRGF